MAQMLPGVTGLLIAGGMSKRMGQDKRWLELSGRTLFQRALDALRELFDEVIVALADPSPDVTAMAVRVVTDLIPNCATLGGLYTGLHHAGAPRVFAVGCDMPFLNPETIVRLATLDDQADVVMARLATGLQPMHAVYSKACLPHLERMAKAHQLKVQDLTQVPGLNVRLVEESNLKDVDPQLLSFFNINTPPDLEFARKLIASGGAS
jgi:molybdopterin-guanine dinucleotide biosynthesis protein A